MDYVKSLKRFTQGKATTEELEEALCERLSMLRETPTVTLEQRLLSSLELALEDAKEGRRPNDDVLPLVKETLKALVGSPATRVS